MRENKDSIVRHTDLVVKHNDFVHAKYHLTITEMRVITYAIAQIQKDDSPNTEYKINIDDIIDMIGSKNKNEFTRIKEICDSLASKFLYIPKGDSEFFHIPFFSRLHYSKNERCIDVVFNHHLQQYLFNLKNRFTIYKMVLPFGSFYAFRIYELIIERWNMNQKGFILEVDSLKEILQVTNKYKLYSDFKRCVFIKSQKELVKHADITFDFEEIKTGRKVTSIRFIIKPNTPTGKPKPKSRLIPEPQTVPEDNFDWSPYTEDSPEVIRAVMRLSDFLQIQFNKNGLDSLAVRAGIREVWEIEAK